jgi:hypothetical protein
MVGLVSRGDVDEIGTKFWAKTGLEIQMVRLQCQNLLTENDLAEKLRFCQILLLLTRLQNSHEQAS